MHVVFQIQRAVPSLRLIMEAPPFWIYWIDFSIFSSREPQLGACPASSAHTNHWAPCFYFYFVFTMRCQQMQSGQSKKIIWER